MEQDNVVVLEPDFEHRLSGFREQVTDLQVQSREIVVTDDTTEHASLIFIGGVKRIIADLETYRKERVRPYNNTVDVINEKVEEISLLARELRDAMDQRRIAYITEKERQIEEANRIAAAKAEQARREKEEKERKQREEAKRLQEEADRIERERIEREIQAEMDRQAAEQRQREEEAAAEAARKAGDAEKAREAEARAAAVRDKEEARRQKEEAERQASFAEQAKLEKKALAVEAKADVTAMEAETVVPEIQFNTSNGVRVLPSGGKVTTREVAKVECWDTGALLYRDPEGAKTRRYHEFDGTSNCVPDELKDFNRYGYLWKFDIASAVAIVKKGGAIPGLTRTTSKKTVGSR